MDPKQGVNDDWDDSSIPRSRHAGFAVVDLIAVGHVIEPPVLGFAQPVLSKTTHENQKK